MCVYGDGDRWCVAVLAGGGGGGEWRGVIGVGGGGGRW